MRHDLPDAPFARGEVWYFELDPVRGHELAKRRPCVIVQRDSANRNSPTLIVCPLSTARGRSENVLNVVIEVGEAGVVATSLVRCNQVRVVDKERASNQRLGSVSAMTMTKIDAGLRVILDLGE